MKKEIFNVANLKINKINKAALFMGLISVARDFDEKRHGVGNDLRSHSLAIAGRLKPDSYTFQDVAADLKSGDRRSMQDGTVKSDIAFKISRGVKLLMRMKSNEDNMKCASYCIDIALRLAPKGPTLDILKDYQKITGKADWTGMLESSANGNSAPQKKAIAGLKERSETITGGNAKKFTAAERSFHGLAMQSHPSGQRVGAVLPLKVAARLYPGTKGIKLHIPHKVGDHTGNSLAKIKTLMRARHEEAGRIPSGYQVDVTFAESDRFLDCPSSGAAMAIAIDALFTGRELDQQFAMVGAIAADGRITSVGAIAAKIRSTTGKGFNIVGIAHGNIRGVSDIYLLGGIYKFKNNQIFSVKTLGEAIEIASKNKSGKIKQTIEDFNSVTKLINPKDLATLKNPKVISQLESVVSRMPNHQSARVLLGIAKGTDRKKFSLGGSFHQIDNRLAARRATLDKMLKAKVLSVYTPDRERFKALQTQLSKMKPRLDHRVASYNNSIIEVLKLLVRGRLEKEERSSFQKRFHDTWKKSDEERQKLIKNSEIMLELAG